MRGVQHYKIWAGLADGESGIFTSSLPERLYRLHADGYYTEYVILHQEDISVVYYVPEKLIHNKDGSNRLIGAWLRKVSRNDDSAGTDSQT